jgi:hypothetical protein
MNSENNNNNSFNKEEIEIGTNKHNDFMTLLKNNNARANRLLLCHIYWEFLPF